MVADRVTPQAFRRKPDDKPGLLLAVRAPPDAMTRPSMVRIPGYAARDGLGAANVLWWRRRRAGGAARR